MKENSEYFKTSVSDFVTLLYQKGYRGRYTVHDKETGPPLSYASLEHCLKVIVDHYTQDKEKVPHFWLRTYADVAQHYECKFKVTIDDVKGFLVKGVDIKNYQTQETKSYPILKNQQIPGSVAVQALFPKPKPWDGIKKGKFRL